MGDLPFDSTYHYKPGGKLASVIDDHTNFVNDGYSATLQVDYDPLDRLSK